MGINKKLIEKTEKLHKSACQNSLDILHKSMNLPVSTSKTGACTSIVIGGLLVAGSFFTQTNVQKKSMIILGSATVTLNGVRYLTSLRKKKL